MDPSASPRFADVPLFVAVNRNTASAAEVLAAALQDNKRAVVVGERSFGEDLCLPPPPGRGGEEEEAGLLSRVPLSCSPPLLLLP